MIKRMIVVVIINLVLDIFGFFFGGFGFFGVFSGFR